MSRSVQAEALAAIRAKRKESAIRYVDLAVTLEESRGRPLLKVGGKWDTVDRCYVGQAEAGRIIRLQPAQDEIGKGLAEWWRRYVTGDWTDCDRIYDWMWRSGRGGGKSWLGSAGCVIHGIAVPGSIVWAVASKEDELDELTHQGIEPHLLKGWARYHVASGEFQLVNGSVIRMLSAFKPDNLKQGRVDFAFLNEAQKMKSTAWTNVRPRVADRGGLCILALNPQSSGIGAWVQKLEERAGPGTGLRATRIDATLNNKRDGESIEKFARLLDDKTRRREIDGEYVPLGDTVIYAWSDEHNVLEVADDWEDITVPFTRAWFGAGFDTVIGCDFDRTPHCAASIVRVYRAPGIDYPLAVQIDEALGDEGEDSLVSALLGLEPLALQGAPDRELLLDPKRTLCIADASNRTQEAGKHQQGASSWRYLAKAGFNPLSPNWPRFVKNPLRVDRYSLQNALCRNSAGERRFFIRHACTWSIESHREFPIVNNKPARWDDHAHIVDATSYALWALFGRDARAMEWLPGRQPKGTAQRYSVDPKRRTGWGSTPAESLASGRKWSRL